MKLNLNTPLTDLDGEPLRDFRDERIPGEEDQPPRIKVTPYTVRFVVLRALKENPSQQRGEGPLSVEDHQKRYELMLKIRDAEEDVELTAEQIAELKRLVAKVSIFGPIVAGQFAFLVENN